jgi:hypothetical protein
MSKNNKNGRSVRRRRRLVISPPPISPTTKHQHNPSRQVRAGRSQFQVQPLIHNRHEAHPHPGKVLRLVTVVPGCRPHQQVTPADALILHNYKVEQRVLPAPRCHFRTNRDIIVSWCSRTTRLSSAWRLRSVGISNGSIRNRRFGILCFQLLRP